VFNTNEILQYFSNKFRNIDIKYFAQCQGYHTENQLNYFKKCADHHKAWDSICNIYRHAIAMELVWPYVSTATDPCVDGYLNWVSDQKDELYKLKYEQVNIIILFLLFFFFF
jgi:hypothetical protein